MPKLDLRYATRIKCASGEVLRMKGHGFAWPTLTERVLRMFGPSDDGALYYLTDDTAGLYQDSVGNLPAAADQPAGLVLDRRYGLVPGAETVANGAFDNGDGWNLVSGSSISGGKLVLDHPASNVNSVFRGTTGASYEFEITVSDYVSGTVNLYFYGGTRASINAPGTYRGIYVGAVNGAATARFLSIGSPVASIASLSIRELPGNHATQATAPARPYYREAVRRIDMDGVDDALTTTFPALGSNCTIARSIPGVGASILSGQTINAGAWANTDDFCALAIINRALTPAENATVTAWLNEQAGIA